jgi:hypothetical protein
MSEPRNPDALPDREPFNALADSVDTAHDLMAWDDWDLRIGQLSIDNM